MAFSRDLRLYWWSPARVIGLGLLPCPIRYFGVLKISKTSSLRLIMSNGRKDQNRARWLLGTGCWLKKFGDGFFCRARLSDHLLRNFCNTVSSFFRSLLCMFCGYYDRKICKVDQFFAFGLMCRALGGAFFVLLGFCSSDSFPVLT